MKSEFIENQPVAETAKKPPARYSRLDPSPKMHELKISYRRRASKKHFAQSERPTLNTPDKCNEYLRCIWNLDTLNLREEFVLVCLDASLAVNGWFRLTTGGIDSCQIDIRLLLGIALKTASSNILVAHNHPSGKLTPSQEDRLLTKRIAAGAKLLNIRLIDHLIVTECGYFSFQDDSPYLFDTGYLINQLNYP